jgi:uncharacterized Zn finger protein/superfamily II DNA or RNA helicase
MSTNQFGKTWWGEQFLNSLSDIDYDNRLPRGRSYAKNGAVESIKIKDNVVSAKVSGSRPRPYKVDIILPPFFDPELSEFMTHLATKPSIISNMLNRKLDSEVLTIAEKHNLKVFPKKWTDFKMQCSCPDWAVPCKHLAAVVYKLSAEIDNNPFLVFNLHNLDLLKEFEKRGIHVSTQSISIPKISELYFSKKKTAREFDVNAAYRKLPFSKLENIHESLSKLLTDYPAFYQGQGNFKDKYSNKLNGIVRSMQRIIQGKDNWSWYLTENETEKKIDRRDEQRILIDENHKTKVLINTKEYNFLDLLKQLIQVPANRKKDYQPSTASLHSFLNLSINLVANGAIVPQIIQLQDKSYSIRWLPAMISEPVRNLVNQLDDMLPPNTFLWQENDKTKEINVDTGFNLLSLFITELVNLLENKRSEDLFVNIFFNKKNYPFINPGEESLAGGILSWIQKYTLTLGFYRAQIVIEESLFGFSMTVNIWDKKSGKLEPIPLKNILKDKEFDSIRFDVLGNLTQISPFIPQLNTYIDELAAKPIQFNEEDFAPFILEIIPAIRLLDLDILLPKSLEEILKPKATVQIKKNEKNTSFFGLNDLFSFNWQVALGDTIIEIDEFKKLLATSKGLIKYKSKYIYVEEGELQKLFNFFTNEKQMSSFELFRTALSGEYKGNPIRLTDEAQAIIDDLTKQEEIELPTNIKASLRPYQKRGYSWMYRNSKIGFGSVLADDMGLGKTLQVITTILKFKEEGALEKEKVLVVAPTGLLSNWESEIKKFAPTLKTKIHHGTQRKLDKEEKFDVLISSYGIVRSDSQLLKKNKWQTLIIDEAQNIKNSNTNQAKAIKSIPAKNFIAMSGTPVENRLSEMWSIMDFSNRGFLGSLKEFNQQFAIPIEQQNDEQAANLLKRTTSPFLMRRLKSDKSIISDLPDKVEMDALATLTKEQASLYEETLQKAMKDIEGIVENDAKAMFVKRALVLQMMLALKQICNHPTNYLKNKVLIPELSGKMQLLFDLLDAIVDSGEKVLIFTQYKEMGDLLQQFIRERFSEEPMFYHGGCSIKERNEMVNRFQTISADQIFILSLKAAGTGLNLTAANHVVHYDLWWNPAVEAQATDRAYRIGQTKNVMVHRFITQNTFEEKINEMIQHKKQLADLTVATGENWIGELSNKELREIFELEKQ